MSSVPIHLTPDEALVLFDWLSRWEETEQLTVEDDSEFIVLAGLLCLLEKQLVEPFMPDYDELVEKARAALRDPQE